MQRLDEQTTITTQRLDEQTTIMTQRLDKQAATTSSLRDDNDTTTATPRTTRRYADAAEQTTITTLRDTRIKWQEYADRLNNRPWKCNWMMWFSGACGYLASRLWGAVGVAALQVLAPVCATRRYLATPHSPAQTHTHHSSTGRHRIIQTQRFLLCQRIKLTGSYSAKQKLTASLLSLLNKSNVNLVIKRWT